MRVEKTVFDCSKERDWYACITELMFWVLTGLNMTAVAFVSHFFPLLQLMLAGNDLSDVLSSTFTEHRGKQHFCSFAPETMNQSISSY